MDDENQIVDLILDRTTDEGQSNRDQREIFEGESLKAPLAKTKKSMHESRAELGSYHRSQASLSKKAEKLNRDAS